MSGDLSKPYGSMDPEAPEGTVVLTRIVIERQLWPDGQDIVAYFAEDRDGEHPPLLEQLGLLSMSVSTAQQIAGALPGLERYDEDDEA